MGLFDFFKGKKTEEQEELTQEGLSNSLEDGTEGSQDEFCAAENDNTILSDLNKMEDEKYHLEEASEHHPVVEETVDESEKDFFSIPKKEEADLLNGEITETIKFGDVFEAAKSEESEESLTSSQIQEGKKGFFQRLLDGLHKTRDSILGGVDTVLGAFTVIDEDLFEELEEVLIMADIGVETTTSIVDALRKRVKRERTTDPALIKDMLIEEIRSILSSSKDEIENLPSPTVLLVIGVNGVGKTTTIGKLASHYKSEGKKVLLAAADTFRAAAIDQLQVWGERSGIDVIRHEERTDPAAVVFDAAHAAKNRKADLLICDTAGRLHNKKNLMDELKKIAKVIGKEFPEAHRETYLVLDATTGQNAIQQARLFSEVAEITGIILTKLDGTAKGGIVIAIKNEMNIPVKYIGVGEGIADLQKFDAENFARALFGESNF